jgi:predicted NBD/HSP70 family sugar kinase
MSPGRAGSLESLRRLNRLRVIRALRDEGTISRADIARRTGLSRSTVSSLVADLQADGLVVERPEPGSAYGAQGGRPPILLSFDASAGAAVGIDFGHSHLRVAVSDLASTILAERTRPLDTDHDAQEGLDAAAELVTEALADAGVARSAVIGAGMGLPGPIEADGVVGSVAILPGWIGMMAESEMRRRLEIPVMVDNDANLGALAEAAFGAGREAGDLIYLKVSSGIGAGLILNGRLYRGSQGLAGELGHVLVDPDGIVCRCGNRGCLETVAATGALVDLLRRSHGEELSVQDMLAAARAGDAGCRRVIHDGGRALGQVVATLLNVLNPELLVVGGDLAAAGDLLLDGVRESVARAALPEASRGAEVVAGVLGDRAQVLGALALVVSEADRALLAA